MTGKPDPSSQSPSAEARRFAADMRERGGAVHTERQARRKQLLEPPIPAEILALREDKVALEQAMDGLEQDNARLEGEKASLEHRRETLERETQSIARSRDALAKEKDELMRERAALKRRTKTLEAQKDALKQKSALVRKEKNQAEQRNKTLEKEKAQLDADIKELEKQSRAVDRRNEINKSKSRQLRKDLRALEIEKAAVECQNADLEQEIATLNNLQTVLERENETLMESLREARGEAEQTQKSLAAARSALMDATNSLEQAVLNHQLEQAIATNINSVLMQAGRPLVPETLLVPQADGGVEACVGYGLTHSGVRVARPGVSGRFRLMQSAGTSAGLRGSLAGVSRARCWWEPAPFAQVGAGAVNASDILGLLVDPGSPPSMGTPGTRLMRLLGRKGWEARGLRLRASKLIDLVLENQLMRYNQPGPDAAPEASQDTRAPVLIITQSDRDLSYAPYRKRSGAAFTLMRLNAKSEHPGHPIIEVEDTQNLHWTDPALKGAPSAKSLHRLISQAKCVYTYNSYLGMMALLHGKPVNVYGPAFYSGFGLTTDRLDAASNRGDREIDEVFAAWAILSPRYRTMKSHLPSHLETVVTTLAKGAAAPS